MKVYRDRCVISTDVTLGSIMTKNATDGEKTIFYVDIIGIQYKAAGVLIGFLPLETGTAQMNNLSTNAFNENTFTFEENLSSKTSIAEIEEARDYIIYQVSKYKHHQIYDSVLACATDDRCSENTGNQDAGTPPESVDKHDDPLIDSFVVPQSDVEAVLGEKIEKEPESPPITTPPSICPQCGNPINSDMLFCGNCGVRLHV